MALDSHLYRERFPDLADFASAGIAIEDGTSLMSHFTGGSLDLLQQFPLLDQRLGRERVSRLLKEMPRLFIAVDRPGDILSIAPLWTGRRHGEPVPLYFTRSTHEPDYLADPRVWQIFSPDHHLKNVVSTVSRQEVIAALVYFLLRSPFAKERMEGADFCILDSLKEGQLHDILHVRPVSRRRPDVDESFVVVVSKSVEGNAVTLQDAEALKALYPTGRVPKVHEVGTLNTADANVCMLVQYLPSREIQLTHGPDKDDPRYRFLEAGSRGNLDISPLRLGPQMVSAILEVTCYDDKVRCIPDVTRGDLVLDDSGNVRIISCGARLIANAFISQMPEEARRLDEIRVNLEHHGLGHVKEHVIALEHALHPTMALDPQLHHPSPRDRFRGKKVHMYTAMDLLCGLANARLNSAQFFRAGISLFAALNLVDDLQSPAASPLVSGWHVLREDLRGVFAQKAWKTALFGPISEEEVRARLQTLIQTKKALAQAGNLNKSSMRYV